MDEPRLEEIEDYNELKGNKKKIVWAVVITGLLIGAVYTTVNDVEKPDDAIKVDKTFKSIPMK